jgi:hypothetical protein
MGPGTSWKEVLEQAVPVDTVQMCAAKVLFSSFGARAKLLPVRVIVIILAVGLPGLLVLVRLSTTVKWPNPSTGFC